MFKLINSEPQIAAFVGLLSALPFLLLNAVVVNRTEPFISWLRPDTHTNLLEQILMILLLLFLPLAGAYVAGRPILKKTKKEKLIHYALNIIIAVILIVGSLTLTTALGMEMYECDVLMIPNCD